MDPAPVADRSTAPDRCPVPHGAPPAAAAPAATCPVPHATTATTEATQGATCPVPHATTATTEATQGATCPVLHGGDPAGRSKADLVVRRILRIRERPPGVSSATAYRVFQKSMLISATRCTLTYVVFPFLLPFLHFLRGGAPIIGVVIGSLALVSDTFTIRRFFAVDHKWRWYFSTLAFTVMCLLSVLLVRDIGDLIAHFG